MLPGIANRAVHLSLSILVVKAVFQCVFTDAYIVEDRQLADRIVVVAKHLVDAAVTKGFTDTCTELVLNMAQIHEGERYCYYYFVDHANRCLFWPADVKMENLLGLFPGITQKSQISTLDEW